MSVTMEKNGWKMLSRRCWGEFCRRVCFVCNLNSNGLLEGCLISVWLIFGNFRACLDVLFGPLAGCLIQ